MKSFEVEKIENLSFCYKYQNSNTKIRYILSCNPKQKKTQGHLLPTSDGTYISKTLEKGVESQVALHQKIQNPKTIQRRSQSGLTSQDLIDNLVPSYPDKS